MYKLQSIGDESIKLQTALRTPSRLQTKTNGLETTRGYQNLKKGEGEQKGIQGASQVSTYTKMKSLLCVQESESAVSSIDLLPSKDVLDNAFQNWILSFSFIMRLRHCRARHCCPLAEAGCLLHRPSLSLFGTVKVI